MTNLFFHVIIKENKKRKEENNMNDETKKAKLKLSTVIEKHYYSEDGDRHTFLLRLEGKQADKIEEIITESNMSFSGDSYPVKELDGEAVLKTSSKYVFPIKGLPSGYSIDDIGSGTELNAYVTMKEGKYGRKKYVSAYITAMDIRRFVEKEETTPFEDDEYTTLDNPFALESDKGDSQP